MRSLSRRLPAVVAPVTLVAVVAAASLAACGDNSGGGEEESLDTSKLVVYSGRNETLVGPLLERFEKDTGIETSVRYGNTAQLAAQLLEEGDRTEADVYFSQDAGALGALEKAGALRPLASDLLSRVDPKYRSDDDTWVGVSARARVIVYDSRKLTAGQVPNSVHELTDARWKGKVGIAPSNASFEAFVTAMRLLDGDDRARQWLERMRDNDVQLYDNNVNILDAVENGRLELGLINHYYWHEKVAEKGAAAVHTKLKFLPNGDPGALVNVAGVGVLAGADRANEARAFVGYLLSDPAQRYFSAQTKEYPLIKGVSPADGLPALDQLQGPKIDLSDLDTLEQTLTMIEEVGLT
jgi:iron(III) transport system substrate-binding protein